MADSEYHKVTSSRVPHCQVEIQIRLTGDCADMKPKYQQHDS